MKDKNNMGEYLIVGLGNPGDEYALTRHNAGFKTVDVIAQRLNARYWKNECGALTARASYHDTELILAKPQSFMNASGGPVKKIMDAYGIDPENLIVIHDELDIPSNKVRVKFGGGHAGHNGLRSICDKLQTRDWYRVRCGIGRPPGKMNVSDFVLSIPRAQLASEFDDVIDTAADATLHLIDFGLDKTQQAFN